MADPDDLKQFSSSVVNKDSLFKTSLITVSGHYSEVTRTSASSLITKAEVVVITLAHAVIAVIGCTLVSFWSLKDLPNLLS